MEGARYIAIEGPIGVGKTSLTELLGRELNARVIFEQPSENPFLEDFYKEVEKYAFKTQLYFLLNRYQQQNELGQCDLFEKTIISDYIFAKDRIFAHINLDKHEIELYEEIYKILDARVPRPDLVIFLQATADTLYERVKIRKRDYEEGISIEYLEKLSQAYNEFFFHYDESPLLVINTTEIDFVNNKDDFRLLIKEIKEMKRGVKHFVPLGSG